MLNKTKLFDKVVTELLLESNPIEYGNQPHIELLVQPTFTNYFFLQITWNQNTMHWYRTTWLREKDRANYQHWFDKNNTDNLDLSLTLLQEKGSDNVLIIKDLIEKITKLTIQPSLEDVIAGRDGEQVFLTIEQPFMRISYLWTTSSTPGTWAKLDEIYQQLLIINKHLQSADCQFLTASWSYEEDNNAINKFLSFEQL